MPATAQRRNAPPFERGAALLGRNWLWFVVRGVLALIVGVAALLFPANALFAFALIFAAFAGADGMVSLIAGIRGATHHQERWGALIWRGIVGIAVAVVYALMPIVATIGYAVLTLAMVIAWAILTGIFEIATAVRLRRDIAGEWLLGLSGVLSILLGLWIWAMMWMFPLASIVSVGWIIAGWALVVGVAQIMLGFRLRRLQHHHLR